MIQYLCGTRDSSTGVNSLIPGFRDAESGSKLGQTQYGSPCWNVYHNTNSLVQKICNSLAKELELRLSCSNPTIYSIHISMVSCQKGPTRHAYAWQIEPFLQDTLDIHSSRLFSGNHVISTEPIKLLWMICATYSTKTPRQQQTQSSPPNPMLSIKPWIRHCYQVASLAR